MKCLKCGAEYEGKFCSECGEPAPVHAPKFCTNCGKELTPGKPFCGFCGTTASDIVSPTQQFQQVPPAPKKKKGGCLKGILIALIILLVISVIGALAGNNDDSETSSTISSSATTTSSKPESSSEQSSSSKSEPQSTLFSIGDTAVERDISVTLLSAEVSDGRSFFAPTDGNIFIIFEFEMENGSSDEIKFSSLLCTQAYCDDYSVDVSITASSAAEKDTLDGTLAPGKKLKGVLGYEVPKDWERMEIVFDWSFISYLMDEVTFAVENET